MAWKRRYAKPRTKKAAPKRKSYAVKRTRSASRPQTVRIELVTTGVGTVARPLAVAPKIAPRRVF